jgi:voltage-gated potassium channel
MKYFGRFVLQIIALMKNPYVMLLTLIGNSSIILASTLFYHLEKDVNKNVGSIIDALWWGFATATTTGYGDITPVTHIGKALGICLMLAGTALFAMFTALFAEIILVSKTWDKIN